MTAFLAGASGAASGPTPGEVALERLETEPIGNVSPGLADMMAQMGVEDAHNLPLGAVKRMAPAIQAAGQMQQAQQKAFLNKRIEKSDIPFWASATGLTEEQAEKAFLKKTPFEVTTA
ncbi:MAG: hypothetical protein GTO63_14005, partial [Anaerolineae bacterium]|nr:hypothetical protein [Anaerolineae bacterium]NIQ78922.1 hypothetical protein [Anaerolineae bacterium]